MAGNEPEVAVDVEAPVPPSAGLDNFTSDEGHDSAIIETADEVEVPDPEPAPAIAAEPTVEAVTGELPVPDQSAVEAPISEPPISTPPVSDPLLERDAFEPRVAIAHSDLPPPQPLAPPVLIAPVVALRPAPTSPTIAPAPLAPRSQEATAAARVARLVPPRALETARRYPVLWLVAAPLFLGSLLVLGALVSAPDHKAEAKRAAPVSSATALVSATAAAPAVASAPAPIAKAALDAKALAALAQQDPSALSVSDLLFLDEGRAERQRSEAQALAQKLQAQPELVKDTAVQASLLHFASDPATASDALAAMAQAPSPVGPDLLFEVWTNRATPHATAELARSLLYSRDVRPGASPALDVALTLRGTESCADVKAALPKVQSSGDTRTIPSLIKLTYRRGCGAGKQQDCYPCLRSSTRELIASTKAANRRRAPSYGASAR